MAIKAKSIVSLLLAVSLSVSGIPLTGASASAVYIPNKEDESYYNPTFSYPENEFSFEQKVENISEIGKLPSYEEFVNQTGYTNNKILLTDFISEVGIGSSFNISKAESLSSKSILITTAEELDMFSDLVNKKIADETDFEQQYYSAGSFMLGDNIDYSTSSRPTKYKPIGSNEYPFNGTFDGQGFELSNIQIFDTVSATYTGAVGLFGTVGEKGTVKNLSADGFRININYSLGCNIAWIAAVNNGTVEDVCIYNSTIYASNATAGGISAENKGNIQRCYSNGFISVSNTEGAYSEPQPIATVNNGSVNSSYYIENDGNGHGWYSESNYKNYCGTKISYADYIEANMPNTKFHKGFDEYSYPSLAAPAYKNEKYQIDTSANLLYLMKYSKSIGTGGINAVLTRTIDMYSINISKDYNNCFLLDGTLTDTSDISNNIEIGVKKCYSILNLNITNTSFMYHCNVPSSFNDENVGFRNIYFIGGKFTFNSPKRNVDYVLGGIIKNVHSSMDIDIKAVSATNIYKYYFGLACKAADSSNSGNFTVEGF